MTLQRIEFFFKTLRHRRNGARAPGFTLLELLIGFSIFAIIAVTLYSTYAHGVKLSRQTREAEDVFRDARWALGAITADLENMVPYSYVETSEILGGTLIGEHTSRNVNVVNTTVEDDTAGSQIKGIFQGTEDEIRLMIARDGELKIVRYYAADPDETSVHKVIVNQSASKNVAVTNSDEPPPNQLYYLIREESPFHENAEITSAPTVPGNTSTENEPIVQVLCENILKGSLKFIYGYSESKDEDDDDDDQNKEMVELKLKWNSVWLDPANPAAVGVEFNIVNPKKPDQAFPVRRRIFVPTGNFGTEDKT